MIGVDFDNTIVCYDRVIYDTARERGLIPSSVSVSKSVVRDYLRAHGREEEWTELQGYVYGEGLKRAEPFPGALDFFRRCHELALPVSVISHKTSVPFRGPAFDLRDAAQQWLERHGFYDSTGARMHPDQVFFESSKAAKLQRIADLECRYFIDDLPEFLSEPSFPVGVSKILFNPSGSGVPKAGVTTVRSWNELHDWLRRFE